VVQAESAAVEAARRIDAAGAVLAEAAKPEHAGDVRTLLAAAADATSTICGGGMPFCPTFMPPAPAELANALTHADDATFIDGDPVNRRAAVRDFERVAARVRPPLDAWRRLEVLGGTLGGDPLPRAVAQLPYEPAARWAALPFADEAARPKAGRISIVLLRAMAPPVTTAWAGLLLDGWTETIPLPTEQTGLAVHYDDPGAEAPQAVLLAVPPVPNVERWQLEWLLQTLKETMDLAQIRAVDGELLGEMGQLLPAIFLADSTDDVTIRSSFKSAVAREPVLNLKASV
jgi:hypothetical protein